MAYSNPASLTLSTRGSLALLFSFVGLVAIGLPLDRAISLPQQSALSVLPWTFLVIALSLQPRAIQVQVVGLVVLATILECVGSLIWGAYTYRLDNLPLYVPAAHGLFYLSALRAASLPLLQRHARSIVIATGAGASAWMIYGLIAKPLPDLLGPALADGGDRHELDPGQPARVLRMEGAHPAEAANAESERTRRP